MLMILTKEEVIFQNGVGILNIIHIGRVIRMVMIGILGRMIIVSKIVHGARFGRIIGMSITRIQYIMVSTGLG